MFSSPALDKFKGKKMRNVAYLQDFQKDRAFHIHHKVLDNPEKYKEEQGMIEQES